MQFCEWKVSFPVEALEPVFGLRDRGALLVGAIGSGPAVYGGVGEVTTGNRRENVDFSSGFKGNHGRLGSDGGGDPSNQGVAFFALSQTDSSSYSFLAGSVSTRAQTRPGQDGGIRSLFRESEGIAGCSSAAKAGFRGSWMTASERSNESRVFRESVSAWAGERMEDKLAMAAGGGGIRLTPDSRSNSWQRVHGAGDCEAIMKEGRLGTTLAPLQHPHACRDTK